jgi:hypothetical protein
MVFQDQDTLPFPTDTAVPSSPVSNFYVHKGEHPFCRTPGCICHTNDGELKNLLLAVIDRKLKLAAVTGGTIQWEVTDDSA